MRTPGLVTFIIAFAVLVLSQAARGTPPPYLYFETFENGVPDDFRPVTFPASISSVPSGTDGVNAGTFGGSHFAKQQGGELWQSPTRPALAPGSWSYQVDVYCDPAQGANFSFIRVLAGKSDGSFLDSFETLFGASGKYRMQDYYTHFTAVIADAPAWRTIEWAYVPGTTIDTATGRPYLDYVLNVYRDVSVGPDGYRAGVLVASFRDIYDNFDVHGREDTPESTSPVENEFNAPNNQFQYIDNLAVGPLINTPEPAAVAVLFAFVPYSLSRRRLARL